MTNPVVLYSSGAGFFIKPESYRSRALNFNNGLNSAISAQKLAVQFVGSQSLLHLRPSRGMQRSFVVYNSVPGVPLPPAPPSGSWNGWILGIVISVVLPFFTSKWGPLLKLKNEIEEVVETAEHIVDAVEKVAEGVEKVAEDILEDLPAGNLKNFVSGIEHMAEKTGDGAELIGDFIDKVQEVEEKVESLVESVTDEENEVQKEVSVADQAKVPADDKESEIEEYQK